MTQKPPANTNDVGFSPPTDDEAKKAKKKRRAKKKKKNSSKAGRSRKAPVEFRPGCQHGVSGCQAERVHDWKRAVREGLAKRVRDGDLNFCEQHKARLDAVVRGAL